MNTTKTSYIITIIILIFALATSFLVYDLLPEQIPSHWNSQGQVDAYAPKEIGLFIMPIINIIVLIILIIVPKIDPKKNNIAEFREYFDYFIITFTGFLAYLHFLTIFFSMGLINNLNFFLIPAFSVLFFVIGIMIGKAKQNYSIGIRTPWTLANKKVWEKTHKVTAKFVKIAAVISLFGLFFPSNEIFFVLVPILIVFIGSIVYSYYLFSKNNQNKI